MRRTYTIDAGDHYSWPRFPRLLFGRRLRFTLLLNPSCKYEILGPERYDINKAYGFSEGLGNNDSVRIGWNCIEGQLYLYPYVHAGGRNFGAENPKPLCKVPAAEEIRCEVEATHSSYLVSASYGGHTYRANYPRRRTALSWLRWIRYPYFGGTLPAPRTMSLLIKTY